MTIKSPEKYSDIIKLLHGILCDELEDFESLGSDKINEELKKENVNIASMVSSVQQMVVKKRADRRLASAKAKREALAQLSSLKASESSGGIREKLVSIFQEINKDNPQLASAYFRKLEEVSDEDLSSMLEDLQILVQKNDSE